MSAVHSKVLYLEGLPHDVTEPQLCKALSTSATTITKLLLLRKRNALYSHFDAETKEKVPYSGIQALVEFATLEDATIVLERLNNGPIAIGRQERRVHGEFAKAQELHDDKKHGGEDGTGYRRGRSTLKEEIPNRILLVTIQNPIYDIDCDLIQEVFGRFGAIEKCVIFEKPIGLQSLVQFAEEEAAVAAKTGFAGVSIFPNCCSLLITYSNLEDELVVKVNGTRSRDFTNAKLPPVESPAKVEKDAVGSNPTHTSPVLLVSNLVQSVSCDPLFNLFSCYGNVTRVKKLVEKPDHALIQYENVEGAHLAMLHLRGFLLFKQSLEISYSKHKHISRRHYPVANEDRSEVVIVTTKDYGPMTNRFTGKFTHSNRHIYSPTKVLHISNIEETSVDLLEQHLKGFSGRMNFKVRLLPGNNNKQQAIVEFSNIEMATDMLALAHNSELGGRKIKVAFSKQSFHQDHE